MTDKDPDRPSRLSEALKKKLGAVTSTGVLYVSERATGEVLAFKPNAYPFSGTPTYSSKVLDASGKAKGIAVDGFDDGLYVAEGTRVTSYVNELQTVAVESATGGTFKLRTYPGRERVTGAPWGRAGRGRREAE